MAAFNLKPDELRALSDAALVAEHNFAQRQVGVASEAMRTRRRNDEGWYHEEQLQQATNYLRECHAEMQRRKSQGSWDPSRRSDAVRAKAAPSAPKKPAETSQAKVPPRARASAEVERPPIIVIEDGVPRAWRKADRIYK